MNEEEAGLLLTAAAAFDRRTVGEADAVAWQRLLQDYRLDDALEALERHYASSREWVMPFDVIDGIKAIRALRRAEYVREHGVLIMPQGLTPEQELAVRREWERQVGDGAAQPVSALSLGRAARLAIEGRADV